jgi:hypothetical protein
MKTQKKKTFNLNKFQVAKLAQTDLIKGGTLRTYKITSPQNPCDPEVG